MNKDLLSLYDLNRADFDEIFSRSEKLKEMNTRGISYTPLKGKALGDDI